MTKHLLLGVAALGLRASSALASGNARDLSKSPLFEKLVARVNDPKAPPIKIEMGEGAEFRVEGIDGKGLTLRFAGSSPMRYAWNQLQAHHLVKLFDALPQNRETILPLFVEVSDLGFAEEAA